jgi:two-component system, NtrC family, sensor kinase
MHNAPPAFAEARMREPLAHSPPGGALRRMADSKRTVHIPDVSTEPGYIERQPLFVTAVELGGYRAMLSVPMLKDGNLVGAINIYRQEVGPFTDKQIDLVQNFAAQAVIAIENTRLLNELRESLDQQTATSEVLKVVAGSTGELQPVFNAMLANAARLCEARYGAMWLCEKNLWRAGAMHGDLPTAYLDLWRSGPWFNPGPNAPMPRAAAARQPVHIPDMRHDVSYLEGGRLPVSAVEVAGVRTLLCVPMMRENEVIGVITIYRTEVKPFNDKQIELVKNFAAQAVIAIENARLLNELRRRTDDLTESLEQQTATSEVLKVISSSTGDLQPIFQAMLDNATRLCTAKFGLLMLCEGDAFRMVAHLGTDPTYLKHLPSKPFRPGPETLLAQVARAEQVVQIEDLRTTRGYAQRVPIMVAAVKLGGVRTFLGVPMIKDGALAGAILLYRQEVRLFTEKQIELVQNFAAQAVIAIENARLLNELRESLQQQTATADVLKVISRSTFKLQTVLNTLVESAARLCEADNANIWQPKDKVFRLAACYNEDVKAKEFLETITIEAGRGTITGRSLLERKIVHVHDVQADLEYSLAHMHQLGHRTVLAVPMLREGDAIGVLVLTRREMRPFTEKQIELATTFANQAAIAIENVRLFESEQARTRELAQSLADLRTTQDRLVQTEKLASLGQLTAGIAHEIKNPLNFVNNFSGVTAELISELQETLEDVSLNEKKRVEIADLTETLRSNLDKIVQHGKRADAIVKNMLLHSRQGSAEHRPVDINSLVEESLNLAYHGARAEKHGFNITLERSLDPSAGEVDVFPQDITRVLLNLVSNGFYAATKRKAQADGGDYEPTLMAATRNLGESVEIRIRDNGTGIPLEIKEQMFNPFFTTKPAGEGTGLGLSISHDIIVKQHGGSIEVDTQPGEFTEFRVILPRAALSGRM